MKLKAKYVDMDTGEITALLRKADCMEIGVHEGDRIKVNHEGNTVTAIVQTTESVIKEGEIEKEKGKVIWSFDIATPDGRSSAFSETSRSGMR